MKKFILALSLLALSTTTSCATDPSREDLRSPCVSADHPYSPCVRKTPLENLVAHV